MSPPASKVPRPWEFSRLPLVFRTCRFFFHRASARCFTLNNIRRIMTNGAGSMTHAELVPAVFGGLFSRRSMRSDR